MTEIDQTPRRPDPAKARTLADVHENSAYSS